MASPSTRSQTVTFVAKLMIVMKSLGVYCFFFNEFQDNDGFMTKTMTMTMAMTMTMTLANACLGRISPSILTIASIVCCIFRFLMLGGVYCDQWAHFKKFQDYLFILGTCYPFISTKSSLSTVMRFKVFGPP